MKLISNKVEAVLRFNSSARSNDRLLMLKVWEGEGLYFSSSQADKFLNKVSSPESIRRTRQKLQEHGEFLASAAVQEMRAEQQIQTQQELLGDQVLGPAVSWLGKD